MEVKDILGYFRFLLNPKDSISFQRIINTPARGIGAATIQKILDYAHMQNMDLWSTCMELSHTSSFSAKAKLAAFTNFMEGLKDLLLVKSGDQLSVLLTEVLHQSGYLDKLKA